VDICSREYLRNFPDAPVGQQVRKLPAMHVPLNGLAALGTVLILAREEMIAALLGLMVEVCGFQPKFPDPDQTVDDLVSDERLKAVLIDADHPDCSEQSLAAIRARSAAPILFSPFRKEVEVRQLAERLGAKSFTVPIHCDAFAKLLRTNS
jgi:DNA-binding response OmpR family regulator